MTDATTPGTYERARQQSDAALRAALLDSAGQLLEREGSEALTMRRLADAAGCSTTVWYRLFEGKHGVVQALYREGFDRLRRRLETDPEIEPFERLAQLSRAYRDFALEEPAYYRVMFTRPVPQFVPSDDDVDHGRQALQSLVDAVVQVQEVGDLVDMDPVLAAEQLWAAAHGVVSLELAGHLHGERAESVFAAATAAAAAGLQNTGQE